jgi:hypothetical protein
MVACLNVVGDHSRFACANLRSGGDFMHCECDKAAGGPLPTPESELWGARRRCAELAEMMRSGWMVLAALALASAGCGGQTAAERQCEDFASRTHVPDYVNQRNGRLDRDSTTNEILDPETGRVAITRSQEECIRREAQKAIDRYEGT